MSMRHDKDGFLLGEMVDVQQALLDKQEAAIALLRGMDRNVAAIARAVGIGARASRAKPGGAASVPAPRSASTAAAGARAASATSGAARPRDALGRFASTPTAAATPKLIAEQTKAARAVAAAAKRDGKGRFTGGDHEPRGDGSRFGGLGARLGGLREMLRGAGQGAEQIDPAISAAHEVKAVLEPVGRGMSMLFGGGSERKKERWYKRILAALTPKKGKAAAVAAGAGGAGADVQHGSFMGTLFGGIIGKLGQAAAGFLPMLTSLFTRILGPVAALWGSFELGQWVGKKIYDWLDESGIMTKVFDAFDSVRDTVSGAFDRVASAVTGAWDTAMGAWTKAVDFVKSIPEKVGALLDFIDASLRKLPLIGDLYGKAADAAKATAADARKGIEDARNPVVVQTPAGPVVQQPGKAGSVAEAAGRAVGSVAKGVADAKDWVLGKTSERFESGGRGAGTVSSGKGDAGGASYGTYQLSSKMGTLQKFIDAAGYGDQFKGLTPGSREFNAQWQKIAREDPTFGDKQHKFIEDTHFNPQMEMLKKNGIDLSDRGAAVKDAVWSTSVQFGGGSSLISKALAGKDVKSMSDSDLVNSIQDYKAANNDKLFSSSSADVRASTAKRAEAERAALLGLTGVPAVATSAGLPRAQAVSVPATAPERVPAMAEANIPPPSSAEKDRPVQAIVQDPIGQDVGDRNIAHIVSGGLGFGA